MLAGAAVGTGTDTVAIAKTKAPALHVGDVLVAGITSATPEGLLRKVTAVRTAGGQLVAMQVLGDNRRGLD